MAVYDLEEQEQISQLKAWWEQYGKYVTTILVVAALASVGWQSYRWYQDKQAAEAGALFQAMQTAAEGGDVARTREQAGQLIERFPGTVYAGYAALVSANVQFASGDARNARAHLDWLASQGKDAMLRDMARLRIATILLEEGQHAEALAQLSAPSVPSLRARFEALKGDILLADDKPAQAREAYQAALAALAASGAGVGDALYNVIAVKAESLEG